jgi:hypothetical protein
MSLTSGVNGIVTQQNDVYRQVISPVLAGNVVITHNLGFSPVEVEVRSNLNGALVSVNVVETSTNSVTLNFPVAVAAPGYRVSIDA